MKIVFLDAKTLGDDIDYTQFEQLGEVVKYPFSSSEEVPERAADADVLIVNKVLVNENTVGSARNLKLVCVTHQRPHFHSFREDIPRAERYDLGNPGTWSNRPESCGYRRSVRCKSDLLFCIRGSRAGRLSSGGFRYASQGI